MRITRHVVPAISAAALLLSACGGEAERPVDDGRNAGGDVLEGSISDAMIPLDRLRSQGDPAEGATGNEAAADAAGDEPQGGAPAPSPPVEETGPAPAQDEPPAAE